MQIITLDAFLAKNRTAPLDVHGSPLNFPICFLWTVGPLDGPTILHPRDLSRIIPLPPGPFPCSTRLRRLHWSRSLEEGGRWGSNDRSEPLTASMRRKNPIGHNYATQSRDPDFGCPGGIRSARIGGFTGEGICAADYA